MSINHEPSKKTKVYLATSYSLVKGDNGTALEQRTSSGRYWGNLWNKLYARYTEWIRYRRVTRAAAYWLTKGYNVFSPITHSHPLGRMVPDRLNTHTMWLGLDFAWIDACDELWVYLQDGWDKSYGVAREIEYAKSKGMPIAYATKLNTICYLAYATEFN